MAVNAAFAMPHPPIILPEVGRGEERKIAATTKGFDTSAEMIAKIAPETIVIVSPHNTIYGDYFHISKRKRYEGDMKHFGVDISIEVDCDTEFVDELSSLARADGFDAGTLGEDARDDHGTFIPLYFINKKYTAYRLVRAGFSGLPPLAHYHFGQLIASAAEKLGRSTVFVASGDLSHKLKSSGPYGFAKEGPEFDREITGIMDKGDFMRLLTMDPALYSPAAECGLNSFRIMAGVLDGKAVDSKVLSYEGPFGVGYMVCACTVTEEDHKRRYGEVLEGQADGREKSGSGDGYVRLAVQSLANYIKTGRKIKRPDGLPEEMLGKRAGVFVSIKENGQLRGCIGTIEPTKANIADEIIDNAVSAAVRDPRFPPIREEELGGLEVSVDVLGEPESISSIYELDVKEYGVIVQSGFKRGLLLPNLEGVDTPEEQVDIALQKAAIGKGERYSMERFKVVRHK